MAAAFFSVCNCIDAVSTTPDYCASSGCIFLFFSIVFMQFFLHAAEGLMLPEGCEIMEQSGSLKDNCEMGKIIDYDGVELIRS